MPKFSNLLIGIILRFLFFLEILQKFCPTVSLDIMPLKLNRWANVKFGPGNISIFLS